jgi:hypothetical protein
LTVHVHRQSEKKERIWYPSQGSCVLTGCYTNNPHVLVRYDVQDEKDQNLALVLSQYRKSNDLNYTLSCYCTEGFAVTSPEQSLDHCNELKSKWSTFTSGGPLGCATYHQNPQYSILIPPGNNNSREPTSLQISISTTSTTAVHALLVPVRSLGDTSLKAAGEPVIDTGNYRHGFVVSTRTSLSPGAYALVVSNFHVGQTGFYTVKVSSSKSNIRIKKI